MKLSRGVLYMAGSALGFSCMSVLVKLASPRLPTGEIVFFRALVSLVLSIVLVRRAGLAAWSRRSLPLIWRGLVGFGSLTGFYVALARLPLADSATLQNSTPLLTAVLAWWLLDERIGWSTALAIVCGVFGVALIVHPSGAGLDPLGVVAALAGVACSSIAFVTVRRLSRTEHPLVIVLYFPLVATPLALPWMLSSFVVPKPLDVLLLVAIGITTQVAQLFLTHGLSLERAGRAASISYLQVAFAMIWGLLVFGEPLGPWTIAGACLILAGTLVVAQSGTEPVVQPPVAPPEPAP